MRAQQVPKRRECSEGASVSHAASRLNLRAESSLAFVYIHERIRLRLVLLR